MKKLGLLAAGLVAVSSLATAPAVQASGGDYCTSDGELALGVIDLGVAYIDDRNFVFGHGLWIYAETNGTPGLQRGGESVMGADLGGRDSCTEGAGPYDMIIF